VTRRDKNGSVRRPARLFLALLCALSLLSVSAEAAEGAAQQTVKVAVLNNTLYADQDKNGVWSGMDVECMINIAQRAGFRVEFVDSGNDPDFLGNLDNGTYDIVADVSITPERREHYLFTDEIMGTINNTLSVRADDNRWDYGNIDQISRMKIGVLSSYANNADFRAWCGEHGITPAISEYGNTDAMHAALKSGEIDGEVCSAVGGSQYAQAFRTILKFLPESYGFAFRKDDVALKNKVDAAVSQILSVNIDYLTNLKNKYEVQFQSNLLPLSAAETRYIREHPVLTVAAAADDLPYYQRTPDGADAGILPDYYQLLADWTGLQFRYDVCATCQDAVSAVRSGQADVVGLYGNGLISAYQSGLMLSDSISSVSCILLTGPGTDLSGVQRIVSPERAADALRLGAGRVFPGAELTPCKNAQACFSAMKSGQADAALMGLYAATWLMNQTNSTSYSIVPVSGITYDVCIALREESQLLCSILNKGIAATRGSFTGITTRDTMPQSSLRAAVSRIPPAIALSVVGALLALVIGLAWAIVLLRRRQRERTAVLAAQAETERQKSRVEEMQRNTEARNQFFANISHDMRTPLNAILGFAALANRENLPEADRRAYLSKIQTSGTLLLDLINDTLTISKASSGKLELKPRPVRSRALFESIIVPIRQSALKKNITFTADYQGALDRTILADELSVQKILLNLLSNAVKFTPEGGRVSIRLFNDPPQGPDPDSVIVVSDSGVGMSPDFLPRVFDPFTQEKRQGYESVGTGLGLSIVKQLVDLMGGTIQVRSEEGKGTVFTVRLHFEEAAPEDAQRGEEAAVPEQDLSGRRVLLCEDNALNCEIAVALLQDRGIEAVVARNGLEGLQTFAQSRPGEFAAILMDVRMPVMDGYEATRKIRALDRPDAESIPILAMTADAFADDVQRCLDAGMNGHLSKPIDPALLYRTLQRLLSR
jgi:signal transduction histidine kinase